MGGSLRGEARSRFDQFMRSSDCLHALAPSFPHDASVFDVCDMATPADVTVFTRWARLVPKFEYDAGSPSATVYVPTTETECALGVLAVSQRRHTHVLVRYTESNVGTPSLRKGPRILKKRSLHSSYILHRRTPHPS